jgi:hypothetical protein
LKSPLCLPSSFLLLLCLSACSSKEKVQSAAPLQVKFTEQDLNQCHQYEQRVLIGAISGESDFAKDESQARKFLLEFDVNKGLPLAKANLVKGIIQSCSAERIKEFDAAYKSLNRCSLTFSEMGYFQSLAGALRSYRWPTDLKLEGKKVALDYVRFYADGEFPLINRLVALSVLDELSVNQVVDVNLHSEIKQHMMDARGYVESLRSKLDSDPELSCESINIIREELEYSNLLSKKLQDLLKRI